MIVPINGTIRETCLGPKMGGLLLPEWVFTMPRHRKFAEFISIENIYWNIERDLLKYSYRCIGYLVLLLNLYGVQD